MSYELFVNNFFKEPPGELTEDIIRIGRKVFYDPRNNKEFCDNNKIKPYSTGIFLGEEKRRFFPSPACIDRIGSMTKNKAVVAEKGEWMFICGKDILGKSLLSGTPVKDHFVIVSNKEGDILGYGRWLDNKPKKNKPIIKNLGDIGEYLRVNDRAKN